MKRLLIAAAAVAQQSAASTLPDATGVDLLRALVPRPLWLVGTVGDFLGFVAQATAMEHMPPILFTGLRFLMGAIVVLPFALREGRLRGGGGPGGSGRVPEPVCRGASAF